MKTGAALVLSVAGILAAGSAALAVNTQVLSVSPTGTGNANVVLLPNGPVPPVPTAGPKPTAQVTGTQAGAQKAATPAKSSPPKPGSAKSGAPASTAAKPYPAKSAPVAVPGTTGGSAAAPSSGPGGGTSGGVVTVQPVPVPGGVVPVEPGDDKGGLRKAPEPGDDSGGHGADD
ncbi:hypothetical protein QFZ23_002967 [Arthrobacter globiformis]|uniref:hypothetical protein n=1 Tax=Arthrobacter globiformis TaxID=1665 RepID=UPI00277F8793|nr:hypothetical protein [Arthrobacter globiformis]MDQ1059066.1 hypothetical protein [Arthrobacter globiformis]